MSALDGRTEADLRRATSDMYYAMFHRVCEGLVAPIIGANPDSKAFLETYRTLYRLPDHGYLEKRCREMKEQSFPDVLRTFARHLIVMKTKRNDADYDPLARFAISSVQNDLIQTEGALNGFENTAPEEQARFVYHVSLKGRKPD